jgi:hypothetical protein
MIAENHIVFFLVFTTFNSCFIPGLRGFTLERKKDIMKAALFFVGLFFSCFTLLAQSEQDSVGRFDWLKINPNESYADFAWESLPQGITQAMVESLVASPYITSADPITLFYLKDQLLALLPCRFEVLKWTGDAWENLYKGTSSGFNCHPHFFVREGNLYSMGRYGFWQGHSELLKFDLVKGSWDPVSVSSSPKYYAGVGIFVDGDRVFSILGEYIHQPAQLFESEKNGYLFDFKDQSWSALQLDFPEKSASTQWILPSFDLKDYGIQLYQYKADIGILLVHKKQNSIYFAQDNDFGKFRVYSVAVATGNSIVFFDKYGDPTFLTPEKDFEKRFKKVGQITFEQQRSTPWWMDWRYLLAGVLGALMVMGGLWWWMPRKAKEEEPESLELPLEIGAVDEEEGMVRMVARLTAHPTPVVDVHQLDELLGIAGLESLDYRRVRRSRYIKAVNQQYQEQKGKELIVRTKSEVDKRIILYRISP